MSFLEMLDVVNEQLTLEGKDPIAFDHDCREGICGRCGAVINGRPHGPEKAPPCASSTCAISRRRHRCHRALPGQGLQGDQGPGRGPRAPWTRSSRPAGSFRSMPAAPRMPTPSPSPRIWPKRPWTRGLHRLRRLRGRLPQRLGHAVLSAPRSPSWRCCPRAAPRRPDGPSPWCGRWTPGLRQLQQRARMRSRVSQGDLHRQHRPSQPGIFQGQLRLLGPVSRQPGRWLRWPLGHQAAAVPKRIRPRKGGL